MTIREAIERVDSLKYNTYTDAEKVTWLSRLDERVSLMVHGTGKPGAAWYDPESDMETELLVPPPFDEMYIHWLGAQIDYADGEIDKYNGEITLYNAEYSAYGNWYQRKHLPTERGYWKM